MRLIINIEEERVNGKRKMKIRSGYDVASKDSILLRNTGVEIYNALVESLNNGLDQTVVIDEGERK